MAKKGNPYRPKDTNQLAKHIADMATGQIPMDNKETAKLDNKATKATKPKSTHKKG